MNKEIKYVSPFKKLCITVGNLPTAYIESMSYYEGLTFLVNYLSNNVIPALNNNGEAVKELQDKYAELKQYVDEYFENLDVQEEINNKLDEMADSGQLTDIIAQYLGLAGMITFDTVADMKLAENLVNGSKCQTLGFYTVNDGGNALYKVRTITNDDVVDEKTIIALYDDNLIAELIENNEINVKQLGAKGDGSTNDSLVFQTAVNKFGGKTIIVPSGTYIIEEPIDITTAHTKIIGIGVEKPILKKTTNKKSNVSVIYNGVTFDYNNYSSIFNLIFPENSNITHIEINNLSLTSNIPVGETKTHYGIIAPHCTYSNFINVRFSNFSNCLLIQGWLDTIERCSFFTSYYASQGIANYKFISMRFINCYFSACTLSLVNAVKTTLLGCHGDNGNPCYDIIDSESVTLLSCGTETYSMVLRNTNSNVYINGGDYEGHSSVDSTFGGFFINQQNGKTYINDAYIHFEDYAELGDPATKNIVTNSGGIVEVYANIDTPYTYTNYITGNNTYNKINNEIYSNNKKVMNKRNKTITAGNKVEILRLPFTYGKNIQAHVKGYGTFSHTAVMFDTLVTGVSNTSSGVPENVDIDVNDRYIISSKEGGTLTGSITAEQDTINNELVIYFNCSANYHYDVYCEIEYNTIV